MRRDVLNFVPFLYCTYKLKERLFFTHCICWSVDLFLFIIISSIRMFLVFNELRTIQGCALLFLMSCLAAYYSRVCSIIFNELPSCILFKGVLYCF